MKKLDSHTYSDALNRIPVPDGMTGRILERLAQPARHRPTGRVLAAAIAVVLVITGSIITAAALEAKEYRTAVEFFDAYALPTDSLNRNEIKAVYRDITSGSFSLEKTGEILLREVGRPIEGQAITPGVIESAWNARNSNDIIPWPIIEGEYRFEVVEVMDEKRGFLVESHTLARRYAGETMLWEQPLDNFFVDGHIPVEGGILVWGHSFTTGSAEQRRARIALIEENGKIRWDKTIDHRYKNDMPSAALVDGDRLVVFGRGDFVDLTITVYDYAGKELLYTAHEIGNCGIRQAVKLGDGYLVRVGNNWDGDQLLRISREGKLFDTLTYTADDKSYVITDMLELGGQLYLSAYAFPAPAAGDVQGRAELTPVFDYLFDAPNGGYRWNIASDELCAMLKEIYTAVLFLCDPSSGEPTQFYTVDGALGAGLSTDDAGQLCWDTEHFTSAIFSPATSSFTIAADCAILRYTFSADCTLLGETDTGEISGYRR